MTGFDFTAAAALFSYPHNAHRCSTSALKVRRKRYAMPSNNSRPSPYGEAFWRWETSAMTPGSSKSYMPAMIPASAVTSEVPSTAPHVDQSARPLRPRMAINKPRRAPPLNSTS